MWVHDGLAAVQHCPGWHTVGLNQVHDLIMVALHRPGSDDFVQLVAKRLEKNKIWATVIPAEAETLVTGTQAGVVVTLAVAVEIQTNSS